MWCHFWYDCSVYLLVAFSNNRLIDFGNSVFQNNSITFLVAGSSSGGYVQRVQISNGSTITTDISTTNQIEINVWKYHVFVYDSNNGTIKIYVDGVEVGTTSISNSDPGLSSNSIFRIGNHYDNNHRFNGSLALISYSLSAPSPEMVKKIYLDEKFLFRKDAKCTLYGTSDVVTALGHDDTTKLLHVGTSSGRSDFRGLNRINNTTTAVTNAISASNGLIAEQ